MRAILRRLANVANKRNPIGPLPKGFGREAQKFSTNVPDLFKRPTLPPRLVANGVAGLRPFDFGRGFSTIAKQNSQTPIFHDQSELAGLLSSEDHAKWSEFLESGTVFVHHEGHCANTLITELINMNFDNIVLVSKAEECDAEDRVSGKIVVDDFNDLESNYSVMQNYCEKHKIEKARVLVGWGYSSESQQVPIQTARVNDALPGCDFGTPCNSVETLQKIADKDAFDQTVSELGLNVIPNYYNSFGRDFDDQPDNLIRFAKKLFKEKPNLTNLDIYIKHPSTGGGRGIVPIQFDRNELNNDADISEKILKITGAISLCHNEGKAFLAPGVKKPLVLQMGIQDAHHIELQLINKVIAGKRECSAQERGQKKAEGTVQLHPELEKRIDEQAQKFADANNLEGANTLELLVSDPVNPESDFYFLETNTRLQVEHLVTSYEKGLSIPAAILANSIGLDLNAIYQNVGKQYVRHIRLTGVVDGSAEILTNQEEMQQKMNQTFGEGVVEVRIKKNPKIDPLADQQFGALVITSEKDNPQLAVDVLRYFESQFQYTGLNVPFRTIYSVLDAYVEDTPFKVGEYIPPAAPSQFEKESAALFTSLNKHLNGLSIKGETQTRIENFEKLEIKLERLLKEFESQFPLSQQIETLSKNGWDTYWKQQPIVSFSMELRDYLQSQLAHVTHPKIVEIMQKVINRLSHIITMYEAPGVSGAGPQTSAMVHEKDPASNRLYSYILVYGLERGIYMNALQPADGRERGLMKRLSHLIEKNTYGSFIHNEKEYSNYVVTDFDASNNAKLNTRMVFENMLYLRPTYPTLSWNPTMTEDQIKQYVVNQFQEYKRLQDEYKESGVPSPFGYYIKCPSTTDTITKDTILKIYQIIDQEYSNIFGQRIANIKCHMHNLIGGENKDHQTRVAQEVKEALEKNPDGPRLSISATFPLGGFGASHPDITQLDSSDSIQAAKPILEVLHEMMQAFDVSSTVVPDDPSFEGPGGMAATAFNDLKETKRRFPDNEVLQSLTYEQTINLGVSILGMRTMVTPLSQFNFLAGIEIAKHYGCLNNNGQLDLDKTKETFINALESENLECTFPEPVMDGMQRYNSDFPNPQESVVNLILKLNGREKITELPSVTSDISQTELDDYINQLHNEFGFPPTLEDALTALRYGKTCASLQAKKMRGGGSELVSAEDFFTQRDVSIGTIISDHTITKITESGLTYVVHLMKDNHERVVTVPNNKAIQGWVNEQLSSTPKFTGAENSTAFDSFIGAQVTNAIEDGTIIRKGEDGSITYLDREGNELQPIDPANPLTFAELIMMKMSNAQRLPSNLAVGDHEFKASDYFESLRQNQGTIHPGTQGFEMFRLNPLESRYA
ncbi:MAG: hypothetical protein ACON35_01970 [Candidatus Marinamargulisbacteria bacterium]